MLIRQINQNNVCFVIIGIFYIKILVMDPIFVMTAIIFFQKSRDFKNIAIVHIKKNTYRIYFSCIKKHKAKKLIKKSDLIDKTGTINSND